MTYASTSNDCLLCCSTGADANIGSSSEVPTVYAIWFRSGIGGGRASSVKDSNPVGCFRGVDVYGDRARSRANEVSPVVHKEL